MEVANNGRDCREDKVLLVDTYVQCGEASDISSFGRDATTNREVLPKGGVAESAETVH